MKSSTRDQVESKVHKIKGAFFEPFNIFDLYRSY